jgi:ribosomal protein L12E/L44/L45/RPP1/RPP2
MATTVRVEINQKAVAALLKGSEIQKVLRDSGEAISAAAGPGHSVLSRNGGDRAAVFVRTETADAKYKEATERTLTRALDAGRG